jgi:hypothetical protein
MASIISIQFHFSGANALRSNNKKTGRNHTGSYLKGFQDLNSERDQDLQDRFCGGIHVILRFFGSEPPSLSSVRLLALSTSHSAALLGIKG